MKIEIVGPGCAKCNNLYEAAKEAVSKTGSDAEIVKVSEFDEIMKRGVMVTPALIIDGEVKVVGKVPKPEEIAKMIG